MSVFISDRKVTDESATNCGVSRTTPIPLRHREMVVSVLISVIAEQYPTNITASEISRLKIQATIVPVTRVIARMKIKTSCDASDNRPRSSMIAQVVLKTSTVEQDTIVI